jgi:hypothetical protein
MVGLVLRDIAVEAGGTWHGLGNARKGDKAPIHAGQRRHAEWAPKPRVRGLGSRAAARRGSQGDLLQFAGEVRLDPTMAPATWKMALSRSPMPRGSGEHT